jgi:hypothetical protein
VSFVAVVCKNDYPEAVTISFSTEEEARAAGERLRAQRRQKWVDGPTAIAGYPIPYFHVHVFEPTSTERRKFERSDVCDRLEFVERRKRQA